MDGVIGFFGFDIGGEIKLANIDAPYETFAPYYLDWVREASQDELLRMVSALQIVPPDSDNDEIAKAFGYQNSQDFSEKVGQFPEGVLEDALGSPADMLYNGVVYGTTKPSDFQSAEYGYVLDMEQGTLDCYIGHQLSQHEEGLFFAVEPMPVPESAAQSLSFPGAKLYGPRLYASYEWDSLPTKLDFLNNHYRALMMQDEMNAEAAKAQKKARSVLKLPFRRSPLLDETTCGELIKTNGKPCVLRQNHRGNHRSVI